jgi:hypothetical protein
MRARARKSAKEHYQSYLPGPENTSMKKKKKKKQTKELHSQEKYSVMKIEDNSTHE